MYSGRGCGRPARIASTTSGLRTSSPGSSLKWVFSCPAADRETRGRVARKPGGPLARPADHGNQAAIVVSDIEVGIRTVGWPAAVGCESGHGPCTERCLVGLVAVRRAVVSGLVMQDEFSRRSALHGEIQGLGPARGSALASIPCSSGRGSIPLWGSRGTRSPDTARPGRCEDRSTSRTCSVRWSSILFCWLCPFHDGSKAAAGRPP